MITENYIINILDKSFVQTYEVNNGYFATIELPNSFVFSVFAMDKDTLRKMAITEIYKLESYLELDKKKYGYEFEGEYE